MLRHKLLYRLTLLASCLMSLPFFGCSSMIYDDLEECPAGLRLRFEFNYNLLKADAFSTQVKSVNVSAFDNTGACVWSGAESGDALKQPGYIMETPLGEGTYDFIAWCGMLDNAELNLPEIEYEGKKVPLTHGLYSAIISGSDREKRAEAFRLY